MDEQWINEVIMDTCKLMNGLVYPAGNNVGIA